MTSEEAIKEVKNYDNYPNGISKECRDYIVSVLDQEPCEDCWSKKEVVDIINRQRYGIQKISMGIIKEKLEALPTVTPTQKKGKWICVHHIENKITYDSWKCSECQHDFNSEEESMVCFDEYNYCPNCGAEMENE